MCISTWIPTLFGKVICSYTVVLREEDVTKTMYPPPITKSVQVSTHHDGKKLELICDAMRAAMEAINPRKWVLCVVSVHIPGCGDVCPVY